MISVILCILAVVVGYSIGSIPFGYLTALAVRGVDIRTVGSGNIGATNVGRVLGFRYFVLVFTLDLLKGFLPTLGFPRGLASAGFTPIPELGVLVALATILGHNFPIYLKLKGGKGVATSLGALLALDSGASLAAALGFAVFLAVTRFVSLSSMLGGLVFLGVYFLHVDDPWNRDHRAMSALTIGLTCLLIVRHRKNILRIHEGTEPRVNFGRKKSPSGCVAWPLIVILVVVSLAGLYGLKVQASRRSQLSVGPVELTEVERVGTGHQRAERVTFADHGKRLAVTCPRYNRVMLYRVDDQTRLEELRDIELAGKPVAIWAANERFYVLQRPAGDDRHVEPGWWETFDFDGKPNGSRQRAGMYPDDFVVTPDGRHALLLTSGRGEGDSNRPAPALDIVDLTQEPPHVVGHLAFARKGDDPFRLRLSATGRYAVVSLFGTNEVASVDLGDPTRPRLIGRAAISEGAVPRLSFQGADSILMAVEPERDAVAIPCPSTPESSRGLLAATLPRESALALYDPVTYRSWGQMVLRSGSLNLSYPRPIALTFSPERSLLAVANRSGGIHLITVAPREASGPKPTGRMTGETVSVR
ncbi:glycerol-3-phosphate 1-O-acyltransferase PlsY [Singulisphaera rosea]